MTKNGNNKEITEAEEQFKNKLQAAFLNDGKYTPQEEAVFKAVSRLLAGKGESSVYQVQDVVESVKERLLASAQTKDAAWPQKLERWKQENAAFEKSLKDFLEKGGNAKNATFKPPHNPGSYATFVEKNGPQTETVAALADINVPAITKLAKSSGLKER